MDAETEWYCLRITGGDWINKLEGVLKSIPCAMTVWCPQAWNPPYLIVLGSPSSSQMPPYYQNPLYGVSPHRHIHSFPASTLYAPFPVHMAVVPMAAILLWQLQPFLKHSEKSHGFDKDADLRPRVPENFSYCSCDKVRTIVYICKGRQTYHMLILLITPLLFFSRIFLTGNIKWKKSQLCILSYHVSKKVTSVLVFLLLLPVFLKWLQSGQLQSCFSVWWQCWSVLWWVYWWEICQIFLSP